MNRREFLTYSGFSALLAMMGAGGCIPKIYEQGSQIEESLKFLFDAFFEDSARRYQIDTLFIKLINKGVINRKGEINSSIVQELAKTDNVVDYNGWYYTQTELELYSLAYLVHLRRSDINRISNRMTVEAVEITRSFISAVSLPAPISLNNHGILIEWSELTHASLIEIGLHLNRFMLVYYSGTEKIIEQDVKKEPVRLHDSLYHVLNVPDLAIDQGYTAIHLYPRTPQTSERLEHSEELTDNEYTLTYFEPSDLNDKNLHPQKLLELYYHEQIQGDSRKRKRNLDRLLTLLKDVETYRWSHVNLDMVFAFLQIPDPNLHTTLYQFLPHSTTLTNVDGKDILQYLGSTTQPTSPDADVSGINIELYLSPLADIAESYSAWFFIRLVDSDEKWMYYDSFPTETTDTWHKREFYRLPTFLQLKPGIYDITLGFWTATRERLYINVEKDIYWLELARQSIPEEK